MIIISMGMKKIYKLTASVLLFYLILVNSLYAATLDITITGFKNNAGSTLVYLHKQSSSFPFPASPEDAVSIRTEKITAQSAQLTFNNLKPGRYAVSIIHDENGDGKLQSNFIGIPEEGVGVSNNVHGHFGPPSYDDASFTLKDHKHLKIKMHY